MKKNILVGQSGGPTAAINTSLYGVIAEGMTRPEEVDHVYGVISGIGGFLSGHVTDLSLLTHEDLSLLKQTPAAYLGSCHFKLSKNLDTPIYSLLSEKLTAINIGACFYIGGNDSMDAVDKLSRYARIRRETISFIEVPKTIDNDLPVIDHTPGYGSAAKYVASTVREISLDASVCQQPVVTIAELMGHHAGWVTAASVLVRKYSGDNPLLTYMSEVLFPTKQFFKDTEQVLSRQPSVIIRISEGIHDKKGRFTCEYINDAQTDTFGCKMLTGCTKILESYIRNRFRVKIRSVELDINQCCSSLLASAADVEEAECSGRGVVEKALQGETGKTVICSRLSRPGYELKYGLTEIGNVCDREKSFPVEWITVEGSDIGSEFLDYALPLIQGQPNHITENGLSKHLYRK